MRVLIILNELRILWDPLSKNKIKVRQRNKVLAKTKDIELSPNADTKENKVGSIMGRN